MANFGQLVITNAGLQAQVLAQSGGESIKFSKIKMGDGTFTGNISSLNDLVSVKATLTITDGYMQNGAYVLDAFFSNDDIKEAFYWKEIGVFIRNASGNDVLYAYSNAGSNYDYIPATTDERYAKHIRVATAIGNATNIEIVESEGIVFVDYQTYKTDMDGKADISALTAHTTDSSMHTSTSEKNTWNAKYNKPSSGIPKADLDSAVQTSLSKADTALQEHQDISGKADISALTAHTTDSSMHTSTSEKNTWNAKYNKPSSGIPKADLDSAVQTSLSKADTALQEHQDISGKADISALTAHTTDSSMHTSTSEKNTWNAKYNKPSSGIPKADLDSAVQTSLSKADTALQEHQDISGKADISALTAHTTDSSMHTSTSEKNTWNAKYNKPSSGIPKADLDSAVQTSLSKADTALQEHQDISGKANKTNTVTATMSTSGWSNGVYSFESTYPNSTYDITIEINGDSATDEQIKAWSKAKIVGSATENKAIAKGDSPTVDIPIIVKVVMK